MLICSAEASWSVIFPWIMFSVGLLFGTACLLLDLLLKDNIDLVSFTVSNSLVSLSLRRLVHESMHVCVWERDKLLSKNHFLLHLMTRIINIIFSGLLGVLSPTGMLCLPGFQPRFEYLLELLDLKEEFAWPCFSWCKCLLDATEGDRTPSAQPRCTSDPQQDKLHEPAILCMQEPVSISISLWSQKPQLWGMR